MTVWSSSPRKRTGGPTVREWVEAALTVLIWWALAVVFLAV